MPASTSPIVTGSGHTRNGSSIASVGEADGDASGVDSSSGASEASGEASISGEPVAGPSDVDGVGDAGAEGDGDGADDDASSGVWSSEELGDADGAIDGIAPERTSRESETASGAGVKSVSSEPLVSSGLFESTAEVSTVGESD